MLKYIKILILAISIAIAFPCYADDWAITFDSGHSDQLRSVFEASDGGYVMSGWIGDAWIMKVNTDGTVAWQKTYGGADNDGSLDILPANDGGYIVGGQTWGGPAGSVHWWIFKLNPDLSVAWQKTYGGSSTDWFYNANQTTDGGYIAAGSTHSFVAGPQDIWVIKLDTDGNVIWEKTYGAQQDDRGENIYPTMDGGYVILGGTWSFGAGADDFWVIKLNSNGSIAWQKTYGGSNREEPQRILQTSDGGYILAGGTESFGAGSADVWLVKLNPTGNIEWQKAYGGPGSEGGEHNILQTIDGGFIYVGRTESYGLGESDILLLKLDSVGNIIWQKIFGGSGQDSPHTVQELTDGGYIIGGTNEGSFGADSWDWIALKLDENGDIPGCEFISDVNVTVTNTNAIVQNTNVVPQDSSAIVTDTNVVPQDTNVEPNVICYYEPGVFTDIPPGYWAADAIYKIYEAGITKGCCQDPLMYCPENPVKRDQMAVFLGRATHDSNFTPPDATGIFADVPKWYWAAHWIEKFYADGLTKGCKVDPHDLQSPVIYYCPKYPVTRTTMAIFLLRAKHGANYQPPPATGIFEDVWVNYWAADWIEQLYREGITTGCKKSPLMYCPANHVTRAQMAVFLTKMLGL